MREITIKFIKLYQLLLSPLLGRHCRFEPTCSEYSILAIKKYGAFKGVLMTLWRILRCNPTRKSRIDIP